MKSTSVRGTPFRSISADNGQGFLSPGAKPKGMSGTVNKQFEGDQSGNRQEGISTGTPYNSSSVNDDTQKGTTSKFGVVQSGGAGDQAQHDSNGNGVLFNGVSRARDYIATPAPGLDSPVPEGSQKPQDDASLKLNAIGNGAGNYWGADDTIEDSLVAAGGIMSRGMSGVSKPGESETSMLEDDYLTNLGSGGV